jgi:uroporphyrin-III C-methyltransferase
MISNYMSDRNVHGVLVVGHGSRRAEANDDVREVARLIGIRGGFELVQAAFLEIEQPDIAEGFRQLVDRGVSNVTVHPYFLSPGRHTRGDLPRVVGRVAGAYPGLKYQITEPLSGHSLVIEASIDRIRETTRSDVSQQSAASGAVYLVGAGPGDPGLLTIRARNLLTRCDVVIYDNLIDPDVLRLVPSKAERVYVGKVGGGRQTSQSEINRLLVQHAYSGKRVVRLKGGDPFLFGRDGEEAQALYEAGILFEVVPGISSALAVPAYAGIPLTHRGAASSVAIVTGTNAGDGSLDINALIGLSRADTLVILMGVAHLREICECLFAAGRGSSTPVAVIRWGTYEAQQTIVGTLHSIVDEAAKSNMRSPAVIVVGEVVRMREQIKWFEKRISENAALEQVFAGAV